MSQVTESTQEPRKYQLAAAVTASEKKAVEMAVEVDGLNSVSEALRTRTVSQLIERGEDLIAHLRSIPPAQLAS